MLNQSLPPYSNHSKHWPLDPATVFLNHGSFGATPVEVLNKQATLRDQMESEPVRFMIRELEPLWWEAKSILGKFVGADPNHIVFVRNATMGVNTIIHSLQFNEGDEILTTNHIYGACLHTLNEYAKIKKFKVVIAEVPFPIADEEAVIAALRSKKTSKTKLVLIDHITSATGLIFPVEKIVRQFEAEGIEVLLDGAHAPGFLDLNLDGLAASYYVGNCHKWICSPKGSALLYVRPDKQNKIMPLQFSHVYDKKVDEKSKWSASFFWPGTDDFTAYLSIPFAIDFMGNLMGSWSALQTYNRELCLSARQLIAAKLETALPAPAAMIGNLSNILISPVNQPYEGPYFNYIHPIQEKLFQEYKIEVPIFALPFSTRANWLRIAVQAYNSLEQYEYLADALYEIRATTT